MDKHGSEDEMGLGKEEGGGESEDYLDCCQELIDAVQSGDKQAVGDALKAAIAMAGI